MPTDHVNRILAEWAQERPDLDSSPIAVVGRLSRCTRDIEAKLEANFRHFGLHGGRYDVLATLRRQGPPYRLKPTELQGQVMLTSGAVTHRVDLLEKEGLVVRLPDPLDRRGTLVSLTDAGRARVDDAIASHLATEAAWLAALPPVDQVTLATLLGQLAATHGL